MLKEIDYWLKMSSSNPGGGNNYDSILTNAFGPSVKKDRRSNNYDIINFNEGDTQDDQITMSN